VPDGTARTTLYNIRYTVHCTTPAVPTPQHPGARHLYYSTATTDCATGVARAEGARIGSANHRFVII